MIAIEYTRTSELPWPQAWTVMRWEMAHWVSNYPLHAGIKMIWNEDLLVNQVDSISFHQATQAMHTVLSSTLGSRLEWQVQHLGPEQQHILHFLYFPTKISS